MITLGTQPEDLTVLIPKQGAFTAALVNDGGPWPAGAAIELRFGDDTTSVTWAATITGAEAEWARTAAECAAVLALPRAWAALLYRVNAVVHHFSTDMTVEGGYLIAIGVIVLFWNILSLLLRLRRR